MAFLSAFAESGVGMIRVCEVCGGEFEGRDGSRCCSGKCRVRLLRSVTKELSEEELSVTGEGISVTSAALNVTDKIESVTDNVTDNGKSVTDKLVFGVTDNSDVTDKVLKKGLEASVRKQDELRASRLPEVTLDTPCNTGVVRGDAGETFLDIEKDLHLSLRKDLGIFAWSRDGIFIRPDITIDQVQNIARLIHAKRGRFNVTFPNECR
mgnify:CR=1 FL=1